MTDIPPIGSGNVPPTTGVDNTQQVSKSRENRSAAEEFTQLANSIGIRVVDGKVDFSSLSNSVDGMNKLEFFLQQAMLLIARSKMEEFENNMKDNITESREAVIDAKDQATDIREEATYQMSGAIAGGIMSVAAASVSIAGSGMAMKSASAGGKFKLGAFQASSAKWSGVSQATNSAGTLVDGGMKFGAGESRADQSIDQASATKDQSIAGLARDTAQADQKFIDQLLQILMAIIDTGHEAKAKISG